jgi:heme/copper-type cytochrome/quinol oxidase subunit 3
MAAMDTARPVTELPRVPASRRQRFADNGALGMGLFVFTEVMMFAGFLSAYAIVETNAPVGAWPPSDQPRLPIERTALNTLALLGSGVALWLAGRRHRREGGVAAAPLMTVALALGTLFLVLQGFEWAALLRQGLSLSSSQVGSFFFTIIGAHALHVLVAVAALAWATWALRAGRLSHSGRIAMEIYWYFVVLIWPVLYAVVYL